MADEIEIRAKAQRDFDVKRLTNFTPSYRLRVGDWRVLFEVGGGTVIIHRVLHRREVYR